MNQCNIFACMLLDRERIKEKQSGLVLNIGPGPKYVCVHMCMYERVCVLRPSSVQGPTSLFPGFFLRDTFADINLTNPESETVMLLSSLAVPRNTKATLAVIGWGGRGSSIITVGYS